MKRNEKTVWPAVVMLVAFLVIIPLYAYAKYDAKQECDRIAQYSNWSGIQTFFGIEYCIPPNFYESGRSSCAATCNGDYLYDNSIIGADTCTCKPQQ